MKRTTDPSQIFTLVELLVVISIIAILASLLLPSLNLARDRAKSIACIGNLRQLGQTFTSYANDYNEYLPAARFSIDTSTRIEWRPNLGKLGYLPPYANVNLDSNLGDLAFCPMTHIRRCVYNTYGVPMGNSDIGGITHIEGSSNRFYSRMLRKLNNKHLLLSDSRHGWTDTSEYYTNGTLYINNGTGAKLSVSSSYRAISVRHNKRFNAAFPDGSASSNDSRWIRDSGLYYYVDI